MEFLVFLAFFVLLFKLLILAVVVGAIVYALKRTGRLGRGWGQYGKNPFKPMGEDNALQIARKRYAGGEISREEYEALKRALT